MDIILYEFAKKHNSTKRPTQGTTFACNLKNECSILSPIIELNLGASNSPSYNYAYIASFGRYYFIEDWSYDRGLWTASLTVDVLSTYKTVIGNSELYVLRSASEYDGKIKDTMYPLIYKSVNDATVLSDYSDVKITCNNVTTSNHNLWRDSYSYGTFVISTVNDESDGTGTYLTNEAGFEVFMENLFTALPSDFGDIADGIKKAFFKPLQYIKNCFWLPFTIADTVVDQHARDTIPCGNLLVGCRNASESVNPFKVSPEIQIELDIPEHPLTSDRGLYMNSAPYTELTLTLLPFGVFSIPVGKVMSYTKILCRILVDIKTGNAELFVHPSGTSGYGSVIVHATGKFCMDIPVTENIVDYIGAFGSSIQPLMDTAGLYFATGSGGAMTSKQVDQARTGIMNISSSSITSNIGSVVDSLAPTPSTQGNIGSVLAFTPKAKPVLNAIFYYPTDDDIEHAGRPLCTDKTINTLSGFIMCKDGDIDLLATQDEKNMVSNYLTSGFFYE